MTDPTTQRDDTRNEAQDQAPREPEPWYQDAWDPGPREPEAKDQPRDG